MPTGRDCAKSHLTVYIALSLARVGCNNSRGICVYYTRLLHFSFFYRLLVHNNNEISRLGRRSQPEIINDRKEDTQMKEYEIVGIYLR